MRYCCFVFTSLFLGTLAARVGAEEKPADAKPELLAAFWNVENLFDTGDDAAVEGDEEFTPEARKRWTPQRFDRKLDNLARVIRAMKGGKGPDLLGLAEVENRAVLDALVAKLAPLGRDYKIIHKDSPSDRGIDCALFYDAGMFTLEREAFDRVDALRTRDVVEARLVRNGRPLTVFVNHWPSRANGPEARAAAARVVRGRVDAILAGDPDADVLIVGDLNDHPIDPSVAEVLRAGRDPKQLAGGALYDAMWPVQEAGRGSYVYKNAWEVLDHVIVSKGLLEGDGLRVVPGSVGPAVVVDDQLFDPQGPAIPRPNRTYSGDQYHASGYSDHLPVTAVLLE
jgi:endonuclease/exonuclease/phosphatase family metal-dependent hydrolase